MRSPRPPCSTHLTNAAYAADLLAAFEVDRAALPEIADAASIAGRLTPAGAALTGLAGRHPSRGRHRRRLRQCHRRRRRPCQAWSRRSLGTAEVVGAVTDTLAIDADGLVETHGFLGERFFISNPGWLSGGALTWFLATFGVATAADAGRAGRGSARRRRRPPLPAGAVGRHGAALGRRRARRLLRADLVPRQGGLRPRAARRLRFRHARRRRSSRCARAGDRPHPTFRRRCEEPGVGADLAPTSARRPVEIADVTDSAPLGAAILAASAVGLAASPAEAAGALLGRIETIAPAPAAATVYDRSYRRYRLLFDALTPLYED